MIYGFNGVVSIMMKNEEIKTQEYYAISLKRFACFNRWILC
jgi:hypothetical protein